MILGIDFGTSNSLVSWVTAFKGTPEVHNALDGNQPHPSVVWYYGDQVVVGKRAKDHLRPTDEVMAGNVARSPKLLLGTGRRYRVASLDKDPVEVAADILKFLIKDSRDRIQALSQTTVKAVLTVPVDRDGSYRQALREAARMAGLDIVQFIHEPLAALYGYLAQRPDPSDELRRLENRLVLVFDWGGGTLDLNLCLIRNGNLLQVQNLGTDSVGGNRFDEYLMNWAREQHAQKFGLLPPPSISSDVDARLWKQCELAKIALSTSASVPPIQVTGFFPEGGEARDLVVPITREDLEGTTLSLVDQGIEKIIELLEIAGVTPEDVLLCIPTGGMTQMPAIRHRLEELFTPLQVAHTSPNVIAEGAAWIAHHKSKLCFSKPLELFLADHTYLPLFAEGTELPAHGQSREETFTVYCTDPTVGTANVVLGRPRWPGRSFASSIRVPYRAHAVKVDPNARGFFQRIRIRIHIDQDLVVSTHVASLGPGERLYSESRDQVHDLEFGIRFASSHHIQGRELSAPEFEEPGIQDENGICLRANVSPNDRCYYDVPGDVVESFRPDHFDLRQSPGSDRDHRLLRRQMEEREYYKPW